MTLQEISSKYSLDVIDLLKVDIEGAEEHLFSGSTNWLDYTRCIAVEFHNDTRASSNFDQVVQAHGFRIEYKAEEHTVFAFKE